MAKRKRLTPARLDGLDAEFDAGPETGPAGLETKSMFPAYPEVPAPRPVPRRAPIADVAGDAAATAAFEEVSRSLADARAEGRLIQRLPLEAIDESYLVRDRVLIDDDEMQALCASLRARGQQTAIEVTDLGHGRWGLISGWRRMTALKRLHGEGAGPGTVLAIARRPAEASEAYLAMVEENEIRVGLSFYERARIVLRAVEKRIYASERQALSALFQAASRAKRSKIGSFIGIVQALDAHLRFPAALSERAGLALAAGLERDKGLQQRLIAALEAASPATPEAEAQVIAAALCGPEPEVASTPSPAADPTVAPAGAAAPATPAVRPEPERLRPGLSCIAHPDGRLTLFGPLLNEPEFRARLLAWLGEQNSL